MSQRVTGHVLRKDGKRGSVWYAHYRVPDGRQVQKKLGPVWDGAGRPTGGSLTRKMADEALEALLTDARRGDLVGMARTGVTFADAAAEYLHFCEHVKQIDPTTINDYRSAINKRLLPAFGPLAVEKLTPDLIDAWKEQLIAKGEVSARTINKYLGVLHAIYKRAGRVHGLKTNPASADLVERPRMIYTGEFVTYTREELDQLVAAAETPQDGILYLVLALTGLRLGEASALQWGNVDFMAPLVHVKRNFSDGTLKVPKGKRVRSVPMMPDVIDALAKLKDRADLIEDDDLVFPSAGGGYVSQVMLRRAFYRTITKAGLRKIRLHDLRHLFGSTAITVLDAHSVQAYMGHTHFQTTARYLHHKPRPEDAAKLQQAFAARPLVPDLEAQEVS